MIPHRAVASLRLMLQTSAAVAVLRLIQIDSIA